MIVPDWRRYGASRRTFFGACLAAMAAVINAATAYPLWQFLAPSKEQLATVIKQDLRHWAIKERG